MDKRKEEDATLLRKKRKENKRKRDGKGTVFPVKLKLEG